MTYEERKNLVVQKIKKFFLEEATSEQQTQMCNDILRNFNEYGSDCEQLEKLIGDWM